MEIPSAWFLFLEKPRFMKHVGIWFNPQLHCISSASIYRRADPPGPRLNISSIFGDHELIRFFLRRSIKLCRQVGTAAMWCITLKAGMHLRVSAVSANSIGLCWLLNSISPFGSRSSFSPLEGIEFVHQTKPFFNSHKSTKTVSFSPLWLSTSKVTEEVTLVLMLMFWCPATTPPVSRTPTGSSTGAKRETILYNFMAINALASFRQFHSGVNGRSASTSFCRWNAELFFFHILLPSVALL